jgi:hypothetical protein
MKDVLKRWWRVGGSMWSGREVENPKQDLNVEDEFSSNR